MKNVQKVAKSKTKKARASKKQDLPKYVVLKGDDRHVRSVFRSGNRDKNGKIIYFHYTRKCEPQTADCAAELARWMEDEYNRSMAGVQSAAEEQARDENSFGAYYGRFLEARKKTVAANTFALYRSVADNHVVHAAIAKMQLEEIGPQGDLSSFTYIRREAKRHGIRIDFRRIDGKTARVTRTPLLTPEAVASMFRSGMTGTAIAEVFMAERKTVSRMLKDMGVDEPDRQRPVKSAA